MKLEFKRYPVIGLLCVAAFALPFVLPGEYAVHLAVVIGINTIVVLGLNLLMGYAGQVSLGQAAFVGIGAYTSAILTVKLGLNPWAAMIVGIALSAFTGLIVGVPLLKLRGHYLAMGTLGFGMIANIVLVQWESLTEGTIGIMSIPPLALGGFALDTELRMYCLVAASVILCMTLATNIIDSRVGRAMRAVHGSEVAAETSGVDTGRYKLQVFVLSAAMAGLAGSLYAHHATYIHPGTFGFHHSINLVVMAVLGGMASIWGAVFGAGAVTLIAENLRLFQEFSTIAFGLVLVVIMIFMPTGIWRGASEVLPRLAGLHRKRTVGPRAADV
ncbi:MAG TPA: branched-chain amino acid ABC transporter permease [Armatimonadota bacterium]|nr:branched-chain amino acid ABC transporter permease [Armatimonadota bacterium]